MSRITRREILGSAAAVGGWLALGRDPVRGQEPTSAPSEPAESPGGPYKLPPLPYGYADLEPYIDAQTMKLHHDVHHAGYVSGANAAVAELERIRRVGGQDIRQVRAASEALSFHTSGHLLHSLYWLSMKRDGGGDPPADSEIGALVRRDFGALAAWRAQYAAAAQQVPGSGWAVLAFEPVSQRLLVLPAEKHQNIGVWGSVPLLALDVWEHAYYLKYQNKRSDYIRAFLNVVNWEHVEQRLQAALKLV